MSTISRTACEASTAARYAKGSNVVVLSPDVARVFPDSASANRALRAFVDLMEKLPNFTVTAKR